MQEKELIHRMSAIQRNIMLVLYLLSKKKDGPVSVTDLRRIINKDREARLLPDLLINNFSVSCKTLFQRGLLRKFRDKDTLKVSYMLTENGEHEGFKEYERVMKGDK